MLCRYPVYSLEDVEADDGFELKIRVYKQRRKNFSFIELLTGFLVEWEANALKKTEGFTVRDNNIYNPAINPAITAVPTTTTATEAAENSQVEGTNTSTRYK